MKPRLFGGGYEGGLERPRSRVRGQQRGGQGDAPPRSKRTAGGAPEGACFFYFQQRRGSGRVRRLSTSHGSGRVGSGHEVLQPLAGRVESDRVGTSRVMGFYNLSLVGLGRVESDRVGSDRDGTGRVGSGRVMRFYHLSRVGSG